jgi:nucleoside-diphosphate-sugar epimerase
LLGLIAILARGSGTRAVIHHAPARPDDIRHSVGDATLARAALGVSARWRLEDGLAALAGLAAAK